MIRRLWLAVLIMIGYLSLSCDPHGEKDCEWYLVPEPRDMAKVDKGFISVCARNYKTNKQKCKMQTTMKFAKKVYGKKFRLNDIIVEADGRFPKKIDRIIQSCDNK